MSTDDKAVWWEPPKLGHARVKKAEIIRSIEYRGAVIMQTDAARLGAGRNDANGFHVAEVFIVRDDLGDFFLPPHACTFYTSGDAKAAIDLYHYCIENPSPFDTPANAYYQWLNARKHPRSTWMLTREINRAIKDGVSFGDTLKSVQAAVGELIASFNLDLRNKAANKEA